MFILFVVLGWDWDWRVGIREWELGRGYKSWGNLRRDWEFGGGGEGKAGLGIGSWKWQFTD